MEVELHQYKGYDEIRRHTYDYLQRDTVARLVEICARKFEGQDVGH